MFVLTRWGSTRETTRGGSGAPPSTRQAARSQCTQATIEGGGGGSSAAVRQRAVWPRGIKIRGGPSRPGHPRQWRQPRGRPPPAARPPPKAPRRPTRQSPASGAQTPTLPPRLPSCRSASRAQWCGRGWPGRHAWCTRKTVRAGSGEGAGVKDSTGETSARTKHGSGVAINARKGKTAVGKM